jgi:RHS repeat-associated protein
VWRWDQQEPFGTNPADENPSGLGTFDLPLRLPGQYFDKETNLHYNYFRDYDPSIGRYGESDPIGLRGGLNTYAYVYGSPLTRIDPKGLEVLVCYRKLRMPLLANHMYLWNTVNQSCCGRVPGQGPLADCSESGPADDYCVPIEGSSGMESTLMSCCNTRGRLGRYIPLIDDCVNTVNDCIEQSGLPLPPALPGGARTGMCPSCGLKDEGPSP